MKNGTKVALAIIVTVFFVPFFSYADTIYTYGSYNYDYDPSNTSIHEINCGAVGDVDTVQLQVGGYGAGTPTTFVLSFGGASSTNSTSTNAYPPALFDFTFSPAVTCNGSTTLQFWNTVSNNANVAGAPTATNTQACTTCAGLPSQALYVTLSGTLTGGGGGSGSEPDMVSDLDAYASTTANAINIQTLVQAIFFLIVSVYMTAFAVYRLIYV